MDEKYKEEGLVKEDEEEGMNCKEIKEGMYRKTKEVRRPFTFCVPVLLFRF